MSESAKYIGTFVKLVQLSGKIFIYMRIYLYINSIKFMSRFRYLLGINNIIMSCNQKPIIVQYISLTTEIISIEKAISLYSCLFVNTLVWLVVLRCVTNFMFCRHIINTFIIKSAIYIKANVLLQGEFVLLHYACILRLSIALFWYYL